MRVLAGEEIMHERALQIAPALALALAAKARWAET